MIKNGYFIYCPYCGEEIKIDNNELDPEIDEFEIQCCHCNHDIHIQVEYKPIFQVDKLESGYCMECGESFSFVRNTNIEKVNKYADIPDEQYCLCKCCETKLKFQDKCGDFKFIMRKRH